MSEKQFHVPGPYLWDESYACGFSEIDRQHGRLLELANLLQVTLEKHFGDSIVEEAIQALIWYLNTHFSHEESKLEELGSSDLETVKKVHQELLDELQEFAVEMALGLDADAAPKLKKWIETRLIAHFIEGDKPAFMKAKSPKS
ncbi:MAG: hemerythrin domain-containing protein [Hyphomicrobiales bacterium]|nr:hemerythrin domain-containing protein [Hyphomicrobiales bacterium]